MSRRGSIIYIIMLICLLAACSGQTDTDNAPDGPLLLRDVTLPPNTPGQTQIASFGNSTPFGITPEIISPLNEATLPADFVLVTPTLPPSKTPSQTPTVSITPPPSQTPTVTVTSTSTQPVLPTSIVIPVTSIAVQAVAEVCDSTWFFLQPRPQSCPTNPVLADQGVYQQFENGYMIWVRRTDAIYVMYLDSALPQWEIYRDFFNEGMPHNANEPSPANRWEPVRGFGLLWRNNETVRRRIGWAIQEFETPYSVRLQIGTNGTTYLSDPINNIFGLIADRSSWARYAGG